MMTIEKIISKVLLIAVILTFFVLVLIFWLEGQQADVGRIEYYKLYIDIIKAIWISFLVATLVVLIPQGIAELRHRFEKLKESRIAYSEAKTGVDYLPLRLCTLSLKEAAAHVQQVHVWKHQAELYSELEQHLKRRAYQGSPEQWGDMIFEKLSNAQQLLEAHADDWDDMKPKHRLERLREIQPPVQDEEPNDGKLHIEQRYG
ncbi:MAG: hypothetical protein ACKVQW_06665 [Pyrinomonadaceae bacterium]